MTSKKRHNNADTETFNYNIQNWLTKKTSGTFEENLAYHKAGNILSMMWKNGTTQNKYIYQYDGLNRLTSGVLDNGGYGENFTYDKNGNILTLKRYSKNVLIDDLEMYDYKGNQLLGITENVENHSLTNINSLKEYRPKGDGTFKYDDNGNLIEDSDRKIWKIEYNVLNLPQQIYFKGGNQIINIYAADGRKLEAIYLTKITDNIESIERIFDDASEIREINGKHYIGNIEYEYEKLDDRFSPELTKIFNAEGYFENGSFYYFRKDHLGNNREVWNATQNRTEQINNYYTSGLLWAETTKATILQKEQYTQPYLYNGKEYIEDFGYDIFEFGFRGYYATIGRFTSIDPLAEQNYSGSPYQYATSNFINEIDFMGLSAYTTSDPGEIAALLAHLAAGGTLDEYDKNFWGWWKNTSSYWDAVGEEYDDLFGGGGSAGMNGNGGSGNGLFAAAQPYQPAEGDYLSEVMTEEKIKELQKAEYIKTKILIARNFVDDNTCVTRSMSAVDMIFGGAVYTRGKNKGERIRNEEFFRYAAYNGIVEISDFKGVIRGDATKKKQEGWKEAKLLNKYFSITNSGSNAGLIKSAINSGSVVFAAMYIADKKYHMIVVVGYQKTNGNYIFYDSAYGGLWTLPSDKFNSKNFYYEVNGIK